MENHAEAEQPKKTPEELEREEGAVMMLTPLRVLLEEIESTSPMDLNILLSGQLSEQIYENLPNGKPAQISQEKALEEEVKQLEQNVAQNPSIFKDNALRFADSLIMRANLYLANHRSVRKK